MGYKRHAVSTIRASVVLYNSDPEHVRGVIASCAHSDVNVDLTIIDNSPNDALRPLVLGCNVRYIRSANNLGYGSAHNLALRDSLRNNCDYHLVLNPDVKFGPEVLTALYAFMESNPDVGLVMPQVLYPNNEEQLLCRRLPSPLDLVVRRFGGTRLRKLFQNRMQRYTLAHLDLSVPRSVPSLSGCFMFLRTKVLRDIGLFDERFFMYMEDVDLCRRIGEISRTVYFPEVSIYHGYQKGSYRSKILLLYHAASAIRYFQKWGWFSDQDRKRRNGEAESQDASLFLSPTLSREEVGAD